jgi:hypothetical protein
VVFEGRCGLTRAEPDVVDVVIHLEPFDDAASA